MASLPDAVLEANVTLAYKCVRDVGAMTDDELLTAIHCAGQMSAVADMNLGALIAARDVRAGVTDDSALEDQEAVQFEDRDAQAVREQLATQAALADQARRERKRVRDAAYRERKRARKLADIAAGLVEVPNGPVGRKRAQKLEGGKRKIVLNSTD